MPSDFEEREAKYREHLIELKVRFWTDELASGKGVVRPRHGWTSGVVRISANKTHGIQPTKAEMFNSLAEIPRAIERALIANKIVLHSSKEHGYVSGASTESESKGR